MPPSYQIGGESLAVTHDDPQHGGFCRVLAGSHLPQFWCCLLGAAGQVPVIVPVEVGVDCEFLLVTEDKDLALQATLEKVRNFLATRTSPASCS